MFVSFYNSPIGRIKIVSDGKCLTNLTFDENFTETNSCEVLEKTKVWLDDYFSLSVPREKIKLKLSGTQFQKFVWRSVMRIKYSQSKSYKQIADEYFAKTGKNVSPRTVGKAVGANKILIIIPCHRVLSSNKSLTGYSAGLDKKIGLLNLEGVKYKY